MTSLILGDSNSCRSLCSFIVTIGSSISGALGRPTRQIQHSLRNEPLSPPSPLLHTTSRSTLRSLLIDDGGDDRCYTFVDTSEPLPCLDHTPQDVVGGRREDILLRAYGAESLARTRRVPRWTEHGAIQAWLVGCPCHFRRRACQMAKGSRAGVVSAHPRSKRSRPR